MQIFSIILHIRWLDSLCIKCENPSLGPSTVPNNSCMKHLKGLQTNSCNHYREIKLIRGAAGDLCTTVTLAEVTQGKSDRQMFDSNRSRPIKIHPFYTNKTDKFTFSHIFIVTYKYGVKSRFIKPCSLYDFSLEIYSVEEK